MTKNNKTAVTILCKGYSIETGSKSLSSMDSFIKGKYPAYQLFILCDSNTKKHCLHILFKKSLLLKKATVIAVPEGEENKTLATSNVIWKTLSKNNATRKSLLINLGGGMISDLGGFAASCYMRGIPYINIPTTLLAQVDASVGGKVGIDLDTIKNQIGLFSPPVAIFTSSVFLKTLHKKQLISGFAEITKHALVADKKHWMDIKNISSNSLSPILLEPLINRSIQIKNKIVLKDPRDLSHRQLLNFGHTVGHAIESYSLMYFKKPLLHGEAVGIGMIIESYLSFKKNLLSKKELDEIVHFLLPFYNYTIVKKIKKDILLKIMNQDKKNIQGEIRFTLLKKIGEGKIMCTCSTQQIMKGFDYYTSLI